MDPILIDVPERLVTTHLVLRRPRSGDGPKLWDAVTASQAELQTWMPWAREEPLPSQSEAFARGAEAQFLARKDLCFYGFARGDDDGDDAEGPLLVGCGLHRFDWDVRAFEIGYWRRSGFGGLGLVDEVVNALTAMAFTHLAAQRVEIRMDERNRRSWRVAERCGFTLEGCLRRNALAPDGAVRDTRVYAKVRGVEWREPGATA